VADQEKEKEVKPAEAKEEKKTESKPEAPATGKSSDQKKKINQLTLAEVEKELKSVKEKMGGFGSHHAEHLLLRKKELTGQ